MSTVSRREFLIHSSAGVTCALVDRLFLSRVLRNSRIEDAPLIDTPRDPRQILYARDTDGEGFQLNLGGYDESPPIVTWRDYLQEYHEIDPERLSDEELEDIECGLYRRTLDQKCNSDWYIEAWCRSKSPNALAYKYLESLDLGPLDRQGGREAGELKFMDAPCMGSSYMGVHADDPVSLNLLQQRLNELGENVVIQLVRSW